MGPTSNSSPTVLRRSRLTHQFSGDMFQQRTILRTLLAEAVPYLHHCGSRAQNGSVIQQSGQTIRSQNHHPESAAETKISRDLVYIAKSTETTTDELDKLLERNTLRRALRVSAWINRFIHNCRSKEKRLGPLDTGEIETAKYWWIKRVQLRDTFNIIRKPARNLVLRRTIEEL